MRMSYTNCGTWWRIPFCILNDRGNRSDYAKYTVSFLAVVMHSLYKPVNNYHVVTLVATEK
jgi:hypothetical protein